jgi:SAM-dependent methyltransferase
MRSYRDLLTSRETAHPFDWTDRLAIFVREYERFRSVRGRPLRILDVGCGRDAWLSLHMNAADDYRGVDFYPDLRTSVPYTRIDLNEMSLAEMLAPETWDVIFCGEVLEHLFAPEALLQDLRKLLAKDGIMILSTPNLGFWVNRLLLLVGISPLYLENAAEKKLGRRFRWLGQGNPTEGHVKVFTYRALRDMLALKRLDVIRVVPTYTWDFALDRLVRRISPSLAGNNVVVVRRAHDGARRLAEKSESG